jgi:hypothetical protein|tara:strand:- start:28 stop:2187 length:2160 start_codon:yes stop_codon:yes gene_type:complete
MAQLKDVRRQQKKNAFLAFNRTLFPDGNIPSKEEIFEKVKSGDTSVKTYFINKMYTDGVPVDNFLLKDPDTKDVAKKFLKTFKSVRKAAPNLDALTDRVVKIIRKGVSLDDDYQKMVEAKPFAAKEVQAYKTAYDDTVKQQTEIKLPKPKGTKKLAQGAVPEGVLKTIVSSIKNIPTKEDGGLLRDAVIASLIGYRGEDVSAIQSSYDEAAAEFPVRPYYDIETGSLQAPNIEMGGGRKGKGPPKELGPFLKSVIERRYKNAVQGELFPGIGTIDITKALNTYIYPNLPDSVRSQLIKDPKGFTDIRRVFASAMANNLKKPDVAAALIGHGGEFDADTVMNIFYTDVVDEDAFTKRKDALLEFERLLAKSLDAKSAHDLGFAMGSPLETNVDFIYSTDEFDGKVDKKSQQVELTDEQIQAKREKSIAKDKSEARKFELEGAKAQQETSNIILSEAERAGEVAEAKDVLETAETQLQEQKAADIESKNAADGDSALKRLIDKGKKFNSQIGKGVANTIVGFAGYELLKALADDAPAAVTEIVKDIGLERLLGTTFGSAASFATIPSPAGDVPKDKTASLEESLKYAGFEENPQQFAKDIQSRIDQIESDRLLKLNPTRGFARSSPVFQGPEAGIEAQRELLSKMQTNLKPAETGDIPRITIDSGTVIMPDGSTRPFGPDVSKSKIGTFGRTPDVSPGFATPPSRSDLADETKRQQNFLGR